VHEGSPPEVASTGFREALQLQQLLDKLLDEVSKPCKRKVSEVPDAQRRRVGTRHNALQGCGVHVGVLVWHKHQLCGSVPGI